MSNTQVAALKLDNLQVEFAVRGGRVQAVRGLSLEVQAGQTLAIVGESGCGKSVAMMSLLGLIPTPPGRVVAGTALLNGRPLLGLPERQLNLLRGADIAMIFQDPMSALNPTMRIGDQIAETLHVHAGQGRSEAWLRAVELLDRVGVPAAAERARQYPFEFSGGMLQRAMIAMSLACKPSVLIADEPTTALDVTIQNQVLSLMQELQREMGMAIILITHDLGVVARMADQVAVMYAGQVVEYGAVEDIFTRSAHPYTLGLKQAMPAVVPDRERLQAIPGSPPDLFAPPQGCAYCERCPYAMAICEQRSPDLLALTAGHSARCWLQHPQAAQQPAAVYRHGVAL